MSPVVETEKTAAAINRKQNKLDTPAASARGASTEVVDDPDTLSQADETDSQERDAQQQRSEKQQREQQELLDRQQIRELAARDREVRAHEQAHASVGGQFAGAPSFSYQRGPDGVNYAVGGEVPISLPSGGDDPSATLSAAEQVKRAALAPADPSAQDQRVAAQAGQVAVDARADIVKLQSEQNQQESELARDERAEQQKAQAQDDNTQKAKEDEREQEEQVLESRRRAQELSDQLATADTIESEQTVGSFLDQRA
ncbi:MAG: catalase [Spongiibacteraceae bacterium]|nr:catalase [Spongiibacteraceae bacterium]